MKLSGEQRLECSVEDAWALVNDPETLRACIPGCEALERSGDGYTASVVLKVGPVKATFKGDVMLTDLVPPNALRISGKGAGGIAGFAEGGADVRLAPDGDGTLLTYDSEAKVGGKLAQLGGRLIDSTAQKLAQQFFANLDRRIRDRAAAGSPALAG